MRAKKYFLVLGLILSVVLGSSAAASANPNQGDQGSQLSQSGQPLSVEIKDYSPPEVSFHSQGHIQRWENSPLSAQNPHLWTAMLMTLFVCGGVFTTMYVRKKRREAKVNPADSFHHYLSELKSREERLAKKFQEAERKYCSGEITEADYKRFLKSYEENLAKTQGKIKEIEQLKI